MSPDIAAGVEGLLLGASLIIAIGAQNAFVLRQGLLRRHVLAIVTFSALSDAALIVAGTAGLGSLINRFPQLLLAVTLAGAAFLAWYGGKAAQRAFRPSSLAPADDGPASLARALLTIAAVTWLNPHVYLDTVVLVGGLSSRHAAAARVWFAGGAVAASVLWFTALGFGARLLAPLFRRPLAWRMLDGLIAVVMLSLAAKLVLEALHQTT